MLLLFIIACQSEQVESKNLNIEYQAGIRDVSFVDFRGKELIMTVWYPTIVTDDRDPSMYEPFVISLGGYRATTPQVKDAPLIAFSHGFFAIRYQSAFLMEHLAEQGFVVVAVDHPYNTLYDFDDDKTAQVLLERPDDVRSAVDHLLELNDDPRDPFFQMVNGESYIAMGHSFGSHTAMVLGGGQLDYQGLSLYCEEFPSQRACRYVGRLELEDLSIYGGADSRVSMTIPISPGLWYTFGRYGEGLGSVVNPLLIAGSEDSVLGYETETIPTFDAMDSPKTLVTMNATGHYGMTNICDIASFFTDECTEENFIPVEQVQSATNRIISEWIQFQSLSWIEEPMYDGWIQAQTQ